MLKIIIMKNILKLFIVVVSVVCFFGCQKSPAPAVQGEYKLENQKFIVNGSVVTNTENYPDALIEVTSIDNNNASFLLKNIVLGYEELLINCKIGSQDTKSSDQYSFSGSAVDITNRQIGISGTIGNNSITLNLNDVNSSNIVNKWKPAVIEIPNVGKAIDIYFKLNNPQIKELQIGELKIPIEQIVALINSKMGVLAYPYFSMFDYIEFSNTSYVNVSYKIGHPELSEYFKNYELLFTNCLMYYEDSENQLLNFYGVKTLMDLANKKIKELGVEIPLPSPLTFPFGYSCEKNASLNININQKSFKSYLTAISLFLPNLTYEQIKKFAPNLTQSDFMLYKTIATAAISLLMDSGTTYEIGINFVPYAK